jgi:hypothetical protein
MAEILITSMNVTDNVRISVPKGSPRRAARCSAWRTTDRAEPRITLNSQTNVAFRTSGLARAESSASPTTEKTAQVRRVTERNQSERQLVGLSVVFAAFNKRVYASCPAPVPQSVGKGEHEKTMPIYAHLCKAPTQPLRDLVRVELRAARCGAGALVRQRPSLTVEAPAIAGQRGICPDHPMAKNDDGDGIGAIRAGRL